AAAGNAPITESVTFTGARARCCRNAQKVRLFLARHEALGTREKPRMPRTTWPAYTAIEIAERRVIIRTALPYRVEPRTKARLNGLNAHPNSRLMMRVGRSAAASCGRSSTAASAGESVSELNAEISVENAIVNANCR